MTPTSTRTCCDLLIVDARPEDYGALLRETEFSVAAKLLPTGQSALAYLQHTPGGVWLVNIHLPDMPGLELLTLLRQRRPGASVSLVGDSYSTEDELAARSAGATAFLCKPAETSWLAECHHRSAPLAIHAGPIRAPT